MLSLVKLCNMMLNKGFETLSILLLFYPVLKLTVLFYLLNMSSFELVKEIKEEKEFFSSCHERGTKRKCFVIFHLSGNLSYAL